MTSQDDIAALRILFERGDITHEEYETLRRYVLRGNALPPVMIERARSAPPRRSPPGPAGPLISAVAIRRLEQPGTPGVRALPPAAGLPPNTRPLRRSGSDDRPVGEPSRLPDRPAGNDSARGRQWPRDLPQAPAVRPQGEPARRADTPDSTPTAARLPVRRGADPATRAAGGTAVGRRPALPAGSPTQPARRPAKTRRRRLRRQITLLVSAACVLALVGAGVWWFELRTTFVYPDVYAHQVCTTVSRWQGRLAQQRGDLVAAIDGNATMDQVRDRLVAFYQDAETQTARLSVDLARIGSPRAQGGQAYAKALRNAVASTASAFHDEAERAGNLDTSSRAAFQTGLQLQMSSLDSKTRPILDALSARGADPPLALRLAFDAEPTCAAYTG